MGFSMLSLIELLYWFSLRMWNDRKKKRREERQQEAWGRPQTKLRL